MLRARGVNATFVGHPLLDRARSLPDRAAARQALDLPADAKLLALFPGSRAQEVARHLGPFTAAARELERRLPGLRVVISAAPGAGAVTANAPYPVLHATSFALLRAANAALCKSGTTTLEAAVAGCPLVVAYRTSRWTYALARRLVRVPRIGLVNIVAEREVAPEFVQDAFTPARVADALQPLLDDGDLRRRRMLDDLAAVRAKLGTAGAAGRVADIALELLA
jgi:lipid-A-disaccharide synthase